VSLFDKKLKEWNGKDVVIKYVSGLVKGRLDSFDESFIYLKAFKPGWKWDEAAVAKKSIINIDVISPYYEQLKNEPEPASNESNVAISASADILAVSKVAEKKKEAKR